jgi:hypothetical protein
MDTSAFKQLYTEMIKHSGNVSKIPESQGYKKQIRCLVKESFPHFIVTDNFFYVPAYFTKKAVDDYKSKFSNINITDLKGHLIVITDWTLEMAKVNSSEVFHSYGGLEIKLIVKSFKVDLSKKQAAPVTSNLYRNNEIKTLFQNYTHSCLSSAVKGKLSGESLPDTSKLSGKGNVENSVVTFATGKAFNAWDFKEGKTPVQDMVSIFKLEKGAAALNKLQDASSVSGKVRVISSVKGKKASAKKSTATKSMSKKISKFSAGGKDTAGMKKSTARLAGGKLPSMKSPGVGATPGGTPGFNKDQFRKMVAFLHNQKKKSKK